MTVVENNLEIVPNTVQYHTSSRVSIGRFLRCKTPKLKFVMSAKEGNMYKVQSNAKSH